MNKIKNIFSSNCFEYLLKAQSAFYRLVMKPYFRLSYVFNLNANENGSWEIDSVHLSKNNLNDLLNESIELQIIRS